MRELTSRAKKVDALLNPRNVVVVGASDRPGSWGGSVAQNVKKFGYKGPVYFINPNRTHLWGEPCYPTYEALPSPPDHLAVLIPAPSVLLTIKQGARAGARSATVFSTGFGESRQKDGDERSRQLAKFVTESGFAICGPNCFGNIVGKNSLVTMQVGPSGVSEGPVALVGQSGGVLLYLNNVLRERGVESGYVISTGNELDLCTADYIAYLVTDPTVKLIFCYLEAITQLERFKAVCLLAKDAGKPVVIMKPGSSKAGRAAALAHTGSLAGSAEVFDAVTADLGVVRVDNLDEAIEVIELIVRTGAPSGRRLCALTLSGAYCAFLLDAGEQNSLTYPKFSHETQQKLRAFAQEGAPIENPIDGGGLNVLSSVDTYMACIEALDADPNFDLILVQGEVPRTSEPATEKLIRRVGEFSSTRANKKIVYITMVSHSQSDHSRMLRSQVPHVSFLGEPKKGLRAISLTTRSLDLQGGPAIPGGSASEARKKKAMEILGRNDAQTAINEIQSKELLALYGIQVTSDVTVTSVGEAVAAARSVGFPVVLKIISDEILHKSDVGGVILNIGDEAGLRQAYASIQENIAAHQIAEKVSGLLLGRYIQGGLELALGLHRDPEMGLVTMVAAGGIMLELLNDVSFSGLPLTEESAHRMLAKTRINTLLTGFRRRPSADKEAVVQALLSLSQLAADVGSELESIDINPLVALPDCGGALALDALVVRRNKTQAKVHTGSELN